MMDFTTAQRITSEGPADLLSYERWISFQQLRQNVMPSWWYRETERRTHYAMYVQKAVEWYDAQRSANQGPSGSARFWQESEDGRRHRS